MKPRSNPDHWAGSDEGLERKPRRIKLKRKVLKIMCCSIGLRKGSWDTAPHAHHPQTRPLFFLPVM